MSKETDEAAEKFVQSIREVLQDLYETLENEHTDAGTELLKQHKDKYPNINNILSGVMV